MESFFGKFYLHTSNNKKLYSTVSMLSFFAYVSALMAVSIQLLSVSKFEKLLTNLYMNLSSPYLSNFILNIKLLQEKKKKF